jgi:hypothetical protein
MPSRTFRSTCRCIECGTTGRTFTDKPSYRAHVASVAREDTESEAPESSDIAFSLILDSNPMLSSNVDRLWSSGNDLQQETVTERVAPPPLNDIIDIFQDLALETPPTTIPSLGEASSSQTHAQAASTSNPSPPAHLPLSARKVAGSRMPRLKLARSEKALRFLANIETKAKTWATRLKETSPPSHELLSEAEASIASLLSKFERVKRDDVAVQAKKRDLAPVLTDLEAQILEWRAAIPHPSNDPRNPFPFNSGEPPLVVYYDARLTYLNR